ncbi:iron complex transport system permease protein [Streptosporangium becharense]|uniref:Iron complex transport system permease protein n=1 Tax=Streptosporangium becharense TaxID=1816182 RepID=A0A7W9IDT5_9ACTN|nr:iron chelate uptake ABC transporter family permease subunit [Streptosporangium becharense]MBB2912318.1 iron complex transport system permease protein [Streptosporangium becharense]MBB5818865.1 iron complex transport system permease protein [Streptosporangium becharense]
MRWTVLAVSFVVLAVTAVLSVAVGAQTIPVDEVWRQLWSPDGGETAAVVHDLRVPRTLLGICVGTALGLAGALMQALTRNPLADPGLLGVNSGASLAVVCSILFFDVTDVKIWVVFALVGAALATVTVYVLGTTGRGAANPARLVLAGAAVSAFLIAVIDGVLTLDSGVFEQWRFWDVGALAGRDADVVRQIAPFVAVGAVLALGLGRGLNAVALGEQTGQSLGANLGRIRLVGVVAIMLLCGAATAAAGPIGFIGLMAPHTVRAFAGPDNRWVLAYSAVMAPALLLAADVIGRVVVHPNELESGIVTAFVGAPMFIYLLRRRKITL